MLKLGRSHFPLSAAMILLFSSGALACIYGPPYRTVCRNYSEAGLIVIGKVTNVEWDEETKDYEQIVSVDVEKSYKGISSESITLYQPQSTCDWEFSRLVNKTFLLYLQADKKTGRLSAIGTGAGGEIDRVKDEIRWLELLPDSLNRTYISGNVGVYRRKPFEFLKSLSGVRLRVFNDKFSFKLNTDKYGTYYKWDIPVGKYKVTPEFGLGYKQRDQLEKGNIDFGPIDNEKSDPKDVQIEISDKSCGGIDYVVNKTSTVLEQR